MHDTDILTPPPPPAIVNGLIQQYGAATSGVAGGTGGADTSMRRLRQEVFRRPIDNPAPDNTVMGGIYVDRELIINTDPLALYRYFLEPLGVSVDKWSMGVRGRSRTYTFADLFGSYTGAIAAEMKTGLGLGSLPSSDVCAAVIPMVDTILASLPPTVGAVPKYTDIQRIFNKSCIECHGGLGYPPYQTYGGTFLDVSEDETPPAGDRRMTRSYNRALSYTSMPTGPGGTNVSNSYLFQRITGSTTGTPPHLYDPLAANEDCPNGIMPCGGPPLNSADIETIRRWIIGARAYTEGDPHIKTVDGTSYDFQSAGEFVLLRDEGLEVQARQTPVTTAGPLGPNGHTGLSSCVSVNTAVALRVGPHRVTYQPSIPVRGEPSVEAQPRPGTLLLRVDGKVMTPDGREIVLASGGRIVRTAVPGGIQIDAPGGTVVVVTPGFWTHHQIWYMNIDVRHGRATEGVMGTIAPGNWLPALPDGTFLGPRPASLPQRYQVLYEKFADAWRVTTASSLFDYEAGLSTASFTVASWPMLSPTSCTAPPQPGVPAASAPPVQLAREEAERVCRAVADPSRKDNCITDVMATGEPTFAQTYLATEQIERNAPPSPPVLGAPKDFAEDLARTVDFTWTRTLDGDRSPLRYRHCIWSSEQGFNLTRCKAVSVPLATPRILLHVALVLLLVLLVLVVLSRTVVKRRRWLLIPVAILLLPVIVFYVGRDKTITATVTQLEPGKVFFWKVVADDDQGALVESQTRRLVVKR